MEKVQLESSLINEPILPLFLTVFHRERTKFLDKVRSNQKHQQKENTFLCLLCKSNSMLENNTFLSAIHQKKKPSGLLFNVTGLLTLLLYANMEKVSQFQNIYTPKHTIITIFYFILFIKIFLSLPMGFTFFRFSSPKFPALHEVRKER